jgi:hypothetical protein
MTVLIDEPNPPRRIDEMWAFISSDATGEGVCAMTHTSGYWLPMICADMLRVESLMPVARALATQTNKKIKLIKLTVREEIMEITP